MDRRDGAGVTRRRFLEIGGKGLAAGAAAGLPLLAGGCQTLAPLEEARPVHYPRLAGHKIQSPEHYGLEGCMTSMWFGYEITNPAGRAEDYAAKVGKPPSVCFAPYANTSVTFFWTDQVIPDVERIAGLGCIPFITYELTHERKTAGKKVLDDILTGEYDGQIKEVANTLKAFGERHGGFFIRTMREMNLGIWPWSGDPERFKKAWIHIWTVFDDEEANEYATWAWNPFVGNESGYWYSNSADRYYPGDAYVDWIGLNAFGKVSGSIPFSELLSRGYSAMRRNHPNKPLIVCETGTAEHPSKPNWQRGVFRATKEKFPGLKALNWWSEPNSSRGYDKRIDSSPEALQAFREGISDPYFLGKVPYQVGIAGRKSGAAKTENGGPRKTNCGAFAGYDVKGSVPPECQ